MKPESRDIELIEKRLDGTLDESELREFEQRYTGSADFRRAVVFHQKLLGNLEALRKEELKQEMRGMMVEAKSRRTVPLRAVWVAAATVLIAGSFAVLQLWRGGSSSDDLFERYFDPYPLVSIVRGNEPVKTTTLLKYYATGDYLSFVQAMENGQVSRAETRSEEILLAYGNALMALERSEEAILKLKKIGIGEKYYTDAQWYLALAYLDLKDFEQSKQLLRQLAGQPSFYQSSARKLLEELKE